MTHRRRRSVRLLAGLTAGALALSVAPLLGAGVAGAADTLPPPADPIAEGAFCDGAPNDNPFTDLGAESAETREVILCLVATGLTEGTTPTTYTPGGPVTRRQMALFIKRLADLFIANESDDPEVLDLTPLPAYDGTPDYPDVVLEDAAFREAIGQLTQANIVGGFPGGEFRPNEPVSRRQMAAFINRLRDFMVGEPYDAGNSDYFDDDNGDSGEENLNALASVGIFLGDGQGNVNPGGTLSRRQMANILLRNAQVHFALGLINSPFQEEPPPAGNQSFTVTPGDDIDAEEGDSRDFTVTGLDNTQRYDIVLFECDNVSSTDGVYSFTGEASPNGDDADPGDTTGAGLTTVNGVASTSGDNIAPSGGSISFTVEGTDTVCVVPVVFEDTTNDDVLNIAPATGQPTDDFGAGGATNFIPADATGGAFGPTAVSSANKPADYFVAAGSTYRYDSNDTFTVDGVPSTLAAFEAALSAGDTIAGTYAPEAAASSTFALTNGNPGTPTAVTATQVAGTIELTWTAPAGPVDSYNIYRALSVTNTDCTGVTPGAYTLLSSDTASPYVDSSVTVPEQYCYQVAAVNDGDEGARSTAAFGETTTANASAPTITTVEAIADESFDGEMDSGDIHRFVFSEPMSPTIDDAGSSYRVQDGSGTIAEVTCGTGGTVCALNSSPVMIGATSQPAGTVLTVTIGATQPAITTPGTPDDGVQYPATITQVTSQWDDVALNQLNLADSDDVINVNGAALPTTPIPPTLSSVTGTTGTVTTTWSESIQAASPDETKFHVYTDLTCTTEFADGGFVIGDDDGDGVVTLAPTNALAAGTQYWFRADAAAVEDLDDTDNVATGCVSFTTPA